MVVKIILLGDFRIHVAHFLPPSPQRQTIRTTAKTNTPELLAEAAGDYDGGLANSRTVVSLDETFCAYTRGIHPVFMTRLRRMMSPRITTSTQVN